MENKRLNDILFLAFIFIIIAIIFAYSNFISKKIYIEGANHMAEIYSQVNTEFATIVSKNLNLIYNWRNYILEEGDINNDRFAALLEQRKQSLKFKEFYFIADNGDYISIKNKKGNMQLGDNLNKLVPGSESIVVNVSLPEEEYPVAIFAAPIEKGSYHGFNYCAVAMSYDIREVTDSLNVSAFSGTSQCFVIDSNGDVLFSSSYEVGIDNYFEYIKNIGKFNSKCREKIFNDIKKGETGVIQCILGKSYNYISYRPLGFYDWYLVSNAPRKEVNKGIEEIRIATVLMLDCIFIILSTAIILIFLKRGKKNMNTKISEIKHREELFSLLSRNVDDIFIMLQGDAVNIDYVSPNIERLLGISPEEVKKNPKLIHETIIGGDNKVHIETIKAIPEGKSISTECEHFHKKTGEKRWYRKTFFHIKKDNTDKFILVFSDRTEEIKMNESLKEALNAAKFANEAKSLFLSNMSHDIRTPMNAIVGFAMLLSKNADKEDLVLEYAKKITASSQHLLSLINDVLDMSKIESGKTFLNIAEFSLPELLEELCSILVPQAKAKDQSFDMIVSGKIPEIILGDKLRLNQIMINLISNAIKYTPDGGKIEFIVRRLENRCTNYVNLRFIVKDNGIGMSEEFVKQIFEPFTREVSSVTNSIQGTGLGMAITKNIIDLMGGKIYVKSKQSQGSEFTVDLGFYVLNNQHNDSEFWAKNNIFNIFIIDDDEEVCKGVQQLMSDTGVKVNYSTDALAAIDTITKASKLGIGFDVIIIDWKMPEMDGVEVAKRIRKNIGGSVPILVLTAYDWGDIEEDAKKAGIDVFMSKPFFVSTFRHAIENILGSENNEADKPEESTILEGMRFLAAEDNEINAEILTELLKMKGAFCDIAQNGEKAVEMFEKSQDGFYDMILMDVQMPVMNGYEATRRIRESSHPRSKEIPILAMTANAFSEDVKNAIDAGMNAHLSKPINMDEIIKTITKLKSQN